MTEPHSWPTSPSDTPERRTRRAWWIFVTAFFILGSLIVVRLVSGSAQPIDAAAAGLLVVAGLAAMRYRQSVTALEVGRREEAESFARILSSLSRSVSPDAILGAIVDELAAATGTDHIVVARRRPDARVLEATLISTRPGVHDSTTHLPIGDLEDPLGEGATLERDAVAVPVRAEAPVSVASLPAAASVARAGGGPAAAGASGGLRSRVDDLGSRLAVATGEMRASGPAPGDDPMPRERQLIAERIATRARTVYGLAHTLAAPLTSDGMVIGAIIVSHRRAGAWSPTTRRLLNGAALEASSALSRVYSQRAVEAQASTDMLTGLPNRRYFDEFCGLLARRRRSGDAVGVLMIDIDKFKVLNDTHGHATGDEVLRAVGGAIVGAVREDDVPARYGGEEFVVLLRNPTAAISLEVGERVRSAVAALDLVRFGVRRVTVSVGVAVAHQADQPIDDLLVLADKALFRAKRAGRDRVVAA